MPALRRVVLAGAAGLALRRLARRPSVDLDGAVVLITGGSRGLGLALARESARRGARLALLARNRDEVEAAAAELRASGHDAVGLAVDVRDREQVAAAVAATAEQFGRLDVVVANAGTIKVGPLDVQDDADFAESLDIMYWGVHHTAMAALAHLDEGGRIGVIASIGGKIAVPHLLPYSVAKFATVGFAEGLRTELVPRGIRVTTVIPWLMRTGSHINAVMKGDHDAEYTWFSAGAAMPVLSLPADRAARRIVDGVARGDAEVLLGWQAHVVARFHGLAPATTVRMLSVVDRLLPAAPTAGDPTRRRLGRETAGGVPVVTEAGERAADDLRQR